MSVDVRVRVTEDATEKNIKIEGFVDRDKETELELTVGRKIYEQVMYVLDKTLPPQNEEKKEDGQEESKIIIP
jgi:hypothetical protein